MNKEIASILKGRLLANGGLPFVDSISGLAQRVTYKEVNADENQVTKSMPVSYDNSTAQGCSTTPEKALIPDSSKRGLLYFEDNGAVFVDRLAGGAFKFRSSLTLVCWMNKARLVGESYSEITSYCLATILSKLGISQITNSGNFERIVVTPGRVLPQDASVFARYTYDETTTQYLRPPFEFFAMGLEVEFAIHPQCITGVEFKEEPACY